MDKIEIIPYLSKEIVFKNGSIIEDSEEISLEKLKERLGDYSLIDIKESFILPSILIKINGKDINHDTDYKAFMCFNKNNKGSWAKKHNIKTKRSSFTPLSCSCGIAACAGIHNGIKTKYRESTVKWKITDYTTRKILKSKYLTFDKSLYEKEILSIWTFFKELGDDFKLIEHGSDVTVKRTLDFYKEKYPEDYLG